MPEREWSTIDIGLNLASDHFDRDRVEVVARAKQAGVDIMILTGKIQIRYKDLNRFTSYFLLPSFNVMVLICSVIGSSIKSSEQTFQLAKQYPGVLYSTAGIHPHTAKSCNNQTIPFLRKLLSNKEVSAGKVRSRTYDFSMPKLT